MNHHSLKSAFTLVELAIVIVIVGLLVAGVVGAQSLIESSKRNKVINDVNSYFTAFRAFKLEYDYLPGDLPNAGSYFNLADIPYANLNGNGDKSISYGSETSMVFIHLGRSGILPDSFVPPSGHTNWVQARVAKCGYNAPVGPYEESCYQLINYLHDYEQSSAYNWLVLASERDAGSGWDMFLEGASIENKAAYNIDKKIDDGYPKAGKSVVVLHQGDANATATLTEWGTAYYYVCGGTSTYPTATASSLNYWRLDKKGKVCYMAFRFDS